MQKIKPQAFKQLTTNEIKPSGWLKTQLEIQARGLTGHLDEFYPDIKDSKWTGGDRDGWERVPYWLDGLIPLAYLLDSDTLKTKVKRYIDAVIAGQQPDGWICPGYDDGRGQGTYDLWAAFLMCKVLVVYYECSEDERIEKVIYKTLKNLYSHINYHMIFDWASMRWFECLYAIFWLYERTGEEWILLLAHRLKSQGFDYHTLFEFCPFTEKTEKNRWSFLSHVVGAAMAVKTGAWYGRIHDDPKYSHTADLIFDALQKYHGTVTGMFTGDECLAGRSPIQGTELCAVAELMYSFEQVLARTGDAKWGDRLEYIAFNAYPATVSEDMWTHQYDQMANQVECSVVPDDNVWFTTNSGQSHTFGLIGGCCDTNMHQAFPKFALSAFMLADDGIYNTVLTPSEVTVSYGGANVCISLETEYPFKDTLTYRISTDKKTEFTFGIRIPGWAKNPTVNGIGVTPGKFHLITKQWAGAETIHVKLPSEIEVLPYENDMYAIKKGALLYTLKVDSEWKQVDYGPAETVRVYPHCDYEIFPTSDFNYAISNIDGITFTENDIGEYIFSEKNPPVYADIPCKKITWDKINGCITETPADRTAISEAETIRFIPYGCSTLRVTVLPVL